MRGHSREAKGCQDRGASLEHSFPIFDTKYRIGIPVGGRGQVI